MIWHKEESLFLFAEPNDRWLKSERRISLAGKTVYSIRVLPENDLSHSCVMIWQREEYLFLFCRTLKWMVEKLGDKRKLLACKMAQSVMILAFDKINRNLQELTVTSKSISR
jgi:hypothetical protein